MRQRVPAAFLDGGGRRCAQRSGTTALGGGGRERQRSHGYRNVQIKRRIGRCTERQTGERDSRYS